MYGIETLYILVAVLHIGLAAWVTTHAVLNKRDTRAAIAWTGLAWLAPIVGSLSYFILGINRIQRKATRLGLADALDSAPHLHREEIDVKCTDLVQKNYPTLLGLVEAGNRLTGKQILSGNRIIPLINGDQAFPAMVEAIKEAKFSINLQKHL